MKKCKGFFLLLNAVLTAGVLLSCSMFLSSSDEDSKVTDVTFKHQALTVSIGGSEYLELAIKPAEEQKNIGVKWTSDSAYISINPDSYGVVISGVKEGQTYLKATAGGITATCIVTVSGYAATFEGEPYIYSNTSILQLTPGSTETASVSLYGGLSDDLEDFLWEISDPTVADISFSRNNCIIDAKKVGSTQLVARHPKSEYPYSIIVYSYADEFTEAYLTTDANVVTVNKAEVSSRTLSVSVVNPYSTVKQSGFHWEAVTAPGAEAKVSVTGNGTSAVITPLANGIGMIRVTYDECEWPLDILVRVTTTVQNVYVLPSASVLMVMGSTSPYSVYADVTGYTGFVNPEGYTWEVPAEAAELMTWEATGNCFTVLGKKNGTVKVKLKHELSDYARYVLVILQEQIGSAIDATMFITTSSNYVLTKVGADTTAIAVTLMGAEAGDENGLVWTIDNGPYNSVARIETPHGTIATRAAGTSTLGNLYITPLSVGSAAVTVSHPKMLYSTEILITVLSEYAVLEEPAYLTTGTNILRLLNGTSQTFTANLAGNFLAGDENNITWESSDTSAIRVTPAAGPTVLIEAAGSGSRQTYLTITHPKALSDKRVLVLSADTQEALDAMKGFYSDQTYYRINVNGTADLTLTGFGLGTGDINAIQWTTDSPGIATVQAASGNRLNATISGVNTGTAVITASLSGSVPCLFNVTVLPEGEDTGVVQARYLTTTKNAVVLPAVNETANLTVTGVNISSASMAANTGWTVLDGAIASIIPNGSSATLTALSTGRTKVHVSNSDAANAIDIDVKVGAPYEWDDSTVVYITAETDVVKMVKGTTKTIGASLANSTAAGGFSFTVTGEPLVEATGTWAGTCIIEALDAGMTEITIRNAAAVADKEILVVVANTSAELENMPYLTTGQNVVTLGEASSTTVTVTVKEGAGEYLTGYHWSSGDTTVIDVVGSGQTAVLYGRKIGTAKVTVTNDAIEYPLEIIANCVDPVMAARNPYIMSPNIMTLTVGDAPIAINADLVGGTASDFTGFSWHLTDATIAQVNASNDSAQLKALKEGVTQLIISHPKAGGIDRTVLLICEPKLVQDCYITVTESIIRMSPTDQPKTINATLAGGTDKDKYNFKWWADSYDLIDMNYTAESAVITPLGTGMVTIHISHPKAAYQKDIILYISQFSEFAFEKTSVSLPAGTQSFVNLQVPVTAMATTVSYTSHTPGGGDASATVSAAGTKSVCTVDAHQTGTAIITAKLIALNTGAEQARCDILVNVTPAAANITYINFTGSTIINIDKGVNRNLSAALRGTGATLEDSKSLQWKSSNSDALKLSPASASGIAVNDEVQITALQAGKECTITISHEKANSTVVLYVIIPGDNEATILLDKTEINLIKGDSPFAINSTITNAAENDYNNLAWTVVQTAGDDGTVIELAGTGKKITINPKNIGSATLTAKVPSSGRTASCVVNVERPKTLTILQDTLRLYPGESKVVEYECFPEEDALNIVWTTSDSAFVQVSNDDHAGHVTIFGKYKEGVATITGKTASNATAQLVVTNGYGNDFKLEKTYIKSNPVYTNDGTFKVKYELSPPCAEIYLSGLGSSLALKAGCYDSVTGGRYKITSARYTIDPRTNVATGSFEFVPSGETKSPVLVELINPQYRNQNSGNIETQLVAQKTIQVDCYYNQYTFVPQLISVTGRYSRYDPAIGTFIIGDGETYYFNLVTSEQNGSPVIDSITFTSVNTEPAPPAGAVKQNTLISTSVSLPTGFQVSHNLDYGPGTGTYWGITTAEQTTESTNTTVRAVPMVGNIVVKYRLFGAPGTQKTYSFPVYVEVRNCSKTYY